MVDNIHVYFLVNLQACLGEKKSRGPVDSIALAELMSMGFSKDKGTHKKTLSYSFFSII